ncbi:DUF29 domain-containing protein [Leptolyngbya sp. NIES-2104]|uniref:DUF29 domain-containing protein n=1 Tax=Leptolyngbya sp. NIES-2104 TaxID=1552121 RepID=UPI0006EC5117|nr:DUF29 domain-containing protein [Leptolyngbya sp. NIES-2104]GAP98411.1 hypothetical protein NIES2104_49660 [Leptolyngbya sp. NIES-2104]
MTRSIPQVSLYEQDFALWIDDTAAKLKARKFDQLDIENLIEEIESLGRAEKRELRNRFVVLIAHILKRVYIDSAYDNGNWMVTIGDQRREIRLLLEFSPSLSNFLTEGFSDWYLDALRKVRSEYAKVKFPDEWQFSQDIDAILNETFWKD